MSHGGTAGPWTCGCTPRQVSLIAPLGRAGPGAPSGAGAEPATTRPALIEIELEDMGVTSWWRSLLSTLSSPQGMAVMRFVARDVEHRDCAVAAGPTFLRPRCVPGDLPPDEAWCPGMTASLETVHEILAARGWSSSGRGEHPWSERFTRVVVADS